MFFISVENGIAPFSMALEALGYERFVEHFSAFESAARAGALRVHQPRFAPMIKILAQNALGVTFPRNFVTVVITGKTENVVNESLRELMNSPENVKGDYIRLLLVSQMARAGINVSIANKNILRRGLGPRVSFYRRRSELCDQMVLIF